MLLNCSVGEDSWESLGLQGDPTSPSQRRSVLGVHWKDWCWSWSSNTLATWCEELTRLKRPWGQEGLGAGEGDDRGRDGRIASPTQWTWFWVDFASWWWTGRPGVLRFMGSQRVGHDWVTELTGWHRTVFLQQPAGPPQWNSAGEPGERQPQHLLWHVMGLKSPPGRPIFRLKKKKPYAFYKATPTKWSRKFQTMRHGKKLHTEEESSHSCIRMCTKMLAGTMIVMATNQIPLCSRKENKKRERIGMGNTCKSMANSCQCMTKTTTIF